MKGVLVRPCEPQNRFVTSGKALLAVQSMPEGPDNSISQFQTMVLEKRVEQDVEREDFTVIYMIAYLPADRSFWMKDSGSLSNCCSLLLDVSLVTCPLLV
jgi:hypothetical protein